LGDILLKTICGFLNGRGGIIYIGIKEANDTKKRVVVGQKYSENAK
jgi:predicted HTH transcriptional regulator